MQSLCDQSSSFPPPPAAPPSAPAPHPSCWNMSARAESPCPWPLADAAYQRLTARFRLAPREVEMTAWCQPRGRKSASPLRTSQREGDALATAGCVLATSSAKTLSLATLCRT